MYYCETITTSPTLILQMTTTFARVESASYCTEGLASLVCKYIPISNTQNIADYQIRLNNRLINFKP